MNFQISESKELISNSVNIDSDCIKTLFQNDIDIYSYLESSFETNFVEVNASTIKDSIYASLSAKRSVLLIKKVDIDLNKIISEKRNHHYIQDDTLILINPSIRSTFKKINFKINSPLDKIFE